MLYFALGHASLLAAFAALAFDPAAFAGFFYHPRMLAVVHLVTLGWISSWILGALHLVAPMALRTPLPAKRIDYIVFVMYFFSSTGVVSHFWIGELSGVGWSGLVVAVVFSQVGWKVVRALRRAKIPAGVRLHFYLAFANGAVAAVAGGLFGFNRWHTFLPGFSLHHAYGHAHLAALGWATMMVFAVGYRLLPMLLPSAMPSGKWIYASALLLETGALGLFTAFLFGGAWLWPAALVSAAGIIAFLSQVVWMVRRPKPPPKAMPRPDIGSMQVILALVYLALTTLLGVFLAFAETSDESLRLAAAYGVLGLVGFLAQLVAGVGHRLLPLFAWLSAYSGSNFKQIPPSPHAMPNRPLLVLTVLGWILGVPLLALGVYWQQVELVGVAGWALSFAALTGGFNNFKVLRHGFR